MKHYDSIPHWNKGPFGYHTIAQLKKDGSNMRFEWSKSKGWYKFGTKGVMIDRKCDIYGEGIDIFLNKYGNDLIRIFTDKYPKILSVVAFGEFFGENSFSGQHELTDKKDICLFDVSLYKKGMIDVYEFMKNFGHLDVPTIIYDGEYNMDFINNVRNNVYNLDEGVVCKGLIKTKKDKDQIYSCKVKTDQWLMKVKEKMGDKALCDELNGQMFLIKDFI